MARLFVAVWPPDSVVDELAGLAPGRPGLRPVPPHQLHVTLRFLGDADAGVVAARLDGVTFAAATAVLGPAVRRLGPGAVVVPVSGLDALAAAVGDATGDLGKPAGPFRGHLTLARLRRGHEAGRPRRAVRRRFVRRRRGPPRGQHARPARRRVHGGRPLAGALNHEPDGVVRSYFR